MADAIPAGVQVFIGPANQLELGTVTEGPTGVTLETLGPSRQRLNFTISAPTAEVLTAAQNAETSAAASKTAAETAAAQVTDAKLDEAVLRVITPGTILIDEDGRPYYA